MFFRKQYKYIFLLIDNNKLNIRRLLCQEKKEVTNDDGFIWK